MERVDLCAMAVVFMLVMFLTVALSQRVISWFYKRKWNRILRSIDWPK